MKAWIKLQRDLYHQVQNELKLRLRPKGKTLSSYEKRFKNDQKNLRLASQKELVKALNASDSVFIGDFHTLRQSQRLVLRLLRDPEVQKPKVLAFELISSNHQKLISKWLKNPNNADLEQELQDKLNLESTWGSSWAVYRELFLECSKHRIRIAGLYDHSFDLLKRDQKAALLISKYPCPLWVLFGEFHCARPHLPLHYQKLKPEAKITVIHQNDDESSLQRIGQLSSKTSLVLHAKPWRGMELFTVLHTPVWMKWQSFLDYQIKTTHPLDPYDQVIWSLKTLMHFLKDARYPFPKKSDDILDLNVFTAEDEHFLTSLSKLPSEDQLWILDQLRVNHGAAVPSARCIYLTQTTVNSCAQAAGMYLYRRWSRDPQNGNNFYYGLMLEIMGFLMSKLLNHSRKTRHWKDWNLLSQSSVRKEEARKILYAHSFAEHFSDHQKWTKKLKPHKAEVQSALGRIIADSVFEAFLAGEFSRARLIRLMMEPLKNDLHAFETVLELKSVGYPFRHQESGRW